MSPDAQPATAPAADSALADGGTYPVLALRGLLGGMLMGMANLVPGISGGTMLLAAGVYPGFVTAIAEFTTFKFRPRSIVLFGAIVGSAVLAILLGAGFIKDLVVERRWLMYSVFIGLTLGGAPLVWRLAKPATPRFVAGAVAGFAVMVLMALTRAGDGGGDSSPALLFIGGLAGASAMILPGVSGGYLLLLLGQYVPILEGVQTLKSGLLGDSATGAGFDMALVLESMRVVIPVGVGVVGGVVGVSNLVKWLLDRYAQPTLGVLFGLLFGAVVGLWPFQRGVPPEVGAVIRGVTVTAETVGTIDPDHWPVEYFHATGAQYGIAIGLILAGFAATLLIDRLGAEPGGTPASDA